MIFGIRNNGYCQLSIINVVRNFTKENFIWRITMNNTELNEQNIGGVDENKKYRFSKTIEIINVFLVIVSLLVSCHAIKTSKDLLQYQVEQERLPVVVCLNQNMTTSFKRGYDGEVANFDSIDNMILKVCNVGMGVAQKCEISWEVESIKEACLRVRDLIDNSLIINEFEGVDLSSQSFYIYDYQFVTKEGELEEIIYYDTELKDYIRNSFDIEPIQAAYILPITQGEEEIHIQVPKTFGAMLLEMGNQGITESVSLQLNLYYQDMTGKQYSESVNVSFALDEKTEESEVCNCTYDISVKSQ